jgi:hypothetical protein
VVSLDVRTGLLAIALALPSAACVTGDVPERPSVVLPCAAGGAPTELARAPGCGSINLVVANDNVYWTEMATGLVKSVPACGGTITTIAKGQTSPGALAVDETRIFWVSGKTIMKKTLMGGAATTFVSAKTTTEGLKGENDINALLIDRGFLLFGRFTDALKVPVEGGATPEVIGRSPMSDMGMPAAFAVDDTHLYQTEIFHVAVTRETLDGNQIGLLEDMTTLEPLAPDRIAISQDGILLDAIAVVNGDVIWARRNRIKSSLVGVVGGDQSVAIAEISSFPPDAHDPHITGFVVSDRTIYLGESFDDDIRRVLLLSSSPDPAATDGGIPEPTIIATGQSAPSQFAADANAIYWRTADCKIMRLAK